MHLLSARYQTPAAPSRVFSKAACATCVAEPSARAATLRRRRTRPAPAPCAAAPRPPLRYASGAPGPLGRPAQPHPRRLSATPAAHPQRPAIHFADAPGVGEPRHRQAKLEEIRSTQIAELSSTALVLFRERTAWGSWGRLLTHACSALGCLAWPRTSVAVALGWRMRRGSLESEHPGPVVSE